MEDKKVVKISLSTFLLILAMILIIIMSIFIYILYTKNAQSTEKLNNLNNNVSNLEKTIINFQKSNINSSYTDSTSNISNNTTNNIKSTDNNENNNAKTVYELSGTYEWYNPDGTGITCTFSNGTFTMQSGWNYRGTYVISGNKVKLKTTQMLDKNSNDSKYVPTDEPIEEEWTIDENKLIRYVKPDGETLDAQVLFKK